MVRNRRGSILGFALSISLLGATAVFTSGCTADATGSEALADTEATVFTRLGVCTPAEAADAADELLNRYLDECIENSPDIDLITADNLYEFTTHGYMSYMDLHEAIEGIMESLGVAEIAPEDLRPHFRSWVLPLIETDEEGHAVWRTAPLVVYSAIEIAEKRNAFAAAADPEGVDIEQLSTQWDEVTRGSMLDHDFILPVQLSKDPTFAEIRKYVHGRWVMDWSWGYGAIDDFWQSQEGPEGHPAFEPIAEMLKSRGIKKRYYMFDAGDGYGPWSRNYLVVVDEHQQMYGFMMGYSE